MFKKEDVILGWVWVRFQCLWGKYENVSREEGVSLLNFRKKSVGIGEAQEQCCFKKVKIATLGLSNRKFLKGCSGTQGEVVRCV